MYTCAHVCMLICMSCNKDSVLVADGCDDVLCSCSSSLLVWSTPTGWWGKVLLELHWISTERFVNSYLAILLVRSPFWTHSFHLCLYTLLFSLLSLPLSHSLPPSLFTNVPSHLCPLLCVLSMGCRFAAGCQYRNKVLNEGKGFGRPCSIALNR